MSESSFVLSASEIEENKRQIIELLMSTGRNGMDKLVAWLESSDFFTAPASTKYHLHCKGGLALHSLNVYRLLLSKVESNLIHIKPETVIITTLLHDICKANFYVPTTRNRKINGNWVEVEEWGVEEKLPIGHGDKSCFIVQSFIRLSAEEFAMIRYHMGRETDNNSDYFSKAAAAFPAVAAIHTSDLESAYIVESRL